MRAPGMDGCFSLKCSQELKNFQQAEVEEERALWVREESVNRYTKDHVVRQDLDNEHNHRASGSRRNIKDKRFPVTGVFGSACTRHATIHKMIDMNTGEGSKYPLALLHETLGSELPDAAKPKTVVMYDIVCLLKRSLKKHFPQYMGEERFSGEDAWLLAVPVFHAFAHVMHCQAVHNPAFTGEIGTNDGKSLGKRHATVTLALHDAKDALENVEYDEALFEKTWTEFLKKMSAASCSAPWFDIPQDTKDQVAFHFLNSFEEFFEKHGFSEMEYEGRTFFTDGVKAITQAKEEIQKKLEEEDPGFDFSTIPLEEAIEDADALTKLKEAMYKNCLRVLVMLYKMVLKKLDRGGLGQEHIQKTGKAMVLYREKIDLLLEDYNKQLIHDGERQYELKDIIKEKSRFWGNSNSIRGMSDWLKKRNAEKELKLLKYDVANLLQSAKLEVIMYAEGLERISTSLADAEAIGLLEESKIFKGMMTMLEMKHSKAVEWRINTIDEVGDLLDPSCTNDPHLIRVDIVHHDDESLESFLVRDEDDDPEVPIVEVDNYGEEPEEDDEDEGDE
ncbi:hypothetical protein ABG067_007757, partial [Albugo candida]